MANQFYGDIKPSVTGISIPVLLRSSTNNQAVPSVAHTSVTATYWRQGGSATSITMSALTNLTDAHSGGGWKEVNLSTNPGLYRFDIPDAAFASGAEWVVITLVVSGTYGFYREYRIESGGISEIYSTVTHATYGLDKLVRSATPANALAVDSSGYGAADLKLWKGEAPSALTSGLVQAEASQLGTTAKTDVQTEIDAALDETLTELAQGAPVAQPSLRTGIMLLYMCLRNKCTNDGTHLSFFNDAGTCICKARLSEVSGLVTRDELITGP